MRKIIITGLICLVAGGAYAGLGTTGAAFSRIEVGARPIAMGGAFGTVLGDVNSLYYNPAGIGRISGLELLSTYGMWFLKSYYGYVGVAKSVPGLNSAVGFSAMYLGVGDIPGYNAIGEETENYRSVGMVMGLTWALNLGNSVSIGVTGKRISEEIEDESASAYDVDAGIRFAIGPGLVFGGAVQNILRSEIKHISEGYPMARNVRAGVGYMLGNSLLVGADLVVAELADFNMSSESMMMSMRFGGEYVYSNILSARAGYNMPVGEDILDFFSGLSFGGGLKHEGMQLDYAFVPFGDLPATHRFSFTLKL